VKGVYITFSQSKATFIYRAIEPRPYILLMAASSLSPLYLVMCGIM